MCLVASCISTTCRIELLGTSISIEKNGKIGRVSKTLFSFFSHLTKI
jgi:hypothetical protein